MGASPQTPWRVYFFPICIMKTIMKVGGGGGDDGPGNLSIMETAVEDATDTRRQTTTTDQPATTGAKTGAPDAPQTGVQPLPAQPAESSQPAESDQTAPDAGAPAQTAPDAPPQEPKEEIFIQYFNQIPGKFDRGYALIFLNKIRDYAKLSRPTARGCNGCSMFKNFVKNEIKGQDISGLIDSYMERVRSVNEQLNDGKYMEQSLFKKTAERPDLWDSTFFFPKMGTDQPMFADGTIMDQSKKDEGGCVSLFKPGSNMRNKGWSTELGFEMKLKGIHLIIKKLVKSNDYISAVNPEVREELKLDTVPSFSNFQRCAIANLLLLLTTKEHLKDSKGLIASTMGKYSVRSQGGGKKRKTRKRRKSRKKNTKKHGKKRGKKSRRRRRKRKTRKH